MEQPTYPARVASEVRASIARAGVTAALVAGSTGMSKATLSRKLSGSISAPFNTQELELIARFLHVEPSSFMPPLEKVAA